MKIITICSNEYTAPPPEDAIHASLYISSLLAEGLAKKGHRVVFVCAQGSTVKTEKVFSTTKPFFEVVTKKEWDELQDMRLRAQLIFPFEVDLYLKLLEAIQSERFDVVHFHATPVFMGLPFGKRTGLPNVFTLHGGSTPLELRVTERFNEPNNYFISISDHQRKEFPRLPFFRTIYHGLPLENFAFEPKGGDGMVFCGRLIRAKGVLEAVQVAKRLGRRLLVSGDIRGSQKNYFDEEVMPEIKTSAGLVKFVGLIERLKISQFYRRGKLFLFPLQWEEPFGLILIESMASGTPVVAFARGAVPEVIKDGQTGFLVNPSKADIRGNWQIKKTGLEGIMEAVERIYHLPEEEYLQMRRACREHVEKNFSIEKMVERYEEVFKEVSKR